MFTIHFLLFKYMPNSTHSFSEVGLANTKHAQACTANADKVTEMMGVHGYMTSHAHKKKHFDRRTLSYVCSSDNVLPRYTLC